MIIGEHLQKVLNQPLPQGGRVSLELASPEIFRLRITTAEDFETDTSYAVIRKDWPEFSHAFEKEGDDAYLVKTEKLLIRMKLNPFTLEVTDNKGKKRFATAGQGLAFQKEKITLTRALVPEEGVYGLGEHGETFNRNPGRFRFWNTDTAVDHVYKQYYCNIPFGVGHNPKTAMTHGFFLDNPGELYFDIGNEKPEEFKFECFTGDLKLWLLFADSPAEVLTDYGKLTGTQARPPLWSLGYNQCRWSYPNEKRILEIAENFRKREIPCDTIWLDIDYMERYRLFTWHPDRFPEPEKLLKKLKKEGFSTVCILDPGVQAADREDKYAAKGNWDTSGTEKSLDYKPCEEGLKNPGTFLQKLNGSLFVGRCWPGEAYFPDFTNPVTQKLWAKWMGEALLEKGIDGIWNDMNEPALFSDGPFCKEMDDDIVFYDKGQYRVHRRLHNIYGFSMAKASYKAQEAFDANRRAFCLTRSGWAGIQRYSAVWTGDNNSSYSSMAACLWLNLNMGMSGVPFVGCDIGGFANNASKDLFIRWMEWGVFQPFARGHSTIHTKDHEPWSFGKEAEAMVKHLIELRYQLLPYVYTAFVEASEKGLPVNRPMVVAYPEDVTACRCEDEFMVGESLLVAPVLKPGADHRAVYLPEGDWFHLENGSSYQGKQWYLVEAPLGKPAIFVKADAILPMHPVRQHTKGTEPEATFLDIWPAAKWQGKLVEDDGVTKNYLRGEEARFTFKGEMKDNKVTLSISIPKGNYHSARKSWVLRLHGFGKEILSAQSDGKKLSHLMEKGVGIITIPAEPKVLDITVELAK
jgi:alpha-glucosidase